MSKTADDYFRDWVTEAFGGRYGLQRERLIHTLTIFLADAPIDGSYDYEKLETTIGSLSAWNLIELLNHAGILSYASSARCASLTEAGVALKRYVGSRSVDALIRTITTVDDDYRYCLPDACNCGPDGFDPDRVCPNPFWPRQPKQDDSGVSA